MTTYTKRIVILVGLLLIVLAVIVWTMQERFFHKELLTVEQASQKVATLYAGSVKKSEQIDGKYRITLERAEKTYTVIIDAKTGEVSKLEAIASSNKSQGVKSKETIQSIVTEQQKGKIQEIKLQKNASHSLYIVKVQNAATVRTMVVDAVTGKVLSETKKSATTPNTNKQEPKATVNNKHQRTTSAPVKQNTNSQSTSINAKQKNDNHSKQASQEKTSEPVTEQQLVVISQAQAVQIARKQLQGKVDDVEYEKTSDGGYYLIEIEGKDKAIFQIHAVSGQIMSITQEEVEDSKKTIKNQNVKNNQKSKDDQED